MSGSHQQQVRLLNEHVYLDHPFSTRVLRGLGLRAQPNLDEFVYIVTVTGLVRR